jgi:hypothetical protein
MDASGKTPPFLIEYMARSAPEPVWNFLKRKIYCPGRDPTPDGSARSLLYPASWMKNGVQQYHAVKLVRLPVYFIHNGLTWIVTFFYTDSERNAWNLSVHPWLRISICNNHASSTAKLLAKYTVNLWHYGCDLAFCSVYIPTELPGYFWMRHIPCLTESVGHFYIHQHIKFTMNMAEAAQNTQNNIPPTNTVSTTLGATDMRPLALPCTIKNQQ